MFFRTLSLLTLIAFSFLSADSPDSAIDSAEFTLKNGMKVILKPTTFDEEEFFVRVSALKGYIHLPEKLRPSAEALHEIIWESGIGSLTGDQLSVFLFEKGLELSFMVGPAERYIEGEGPIESAPVLFDLIKNLFVLTRIDEKELPTIKKRLAESINQKSCDKSCQFDSLSLSINTNNYEPLLPLAVNSLDLITSDNAQKVLMSVFQDPSEFVAVVSGDFELDKMRSLVENTLGAIPISLKNSLWIEPAPLTFPQGITIKALPQGVKQESLTRISFPITTPINDSNIGVLDTMVETIEARLREEFQHRYQEMYGVDVSFVFPFYPLMGHPWLTIQFRADSEKTDELKTVILDQLKDLRLNGPKEDDIESAEQLKKQSNEYWNRDNRFWVSVLSQFTMMGWDKNKILANYSGNKTEKTQLDEAIKSYFPLDNYTIVTDGN